MTLERIMHDRMLQNFQSAKYSSHNVCQNFCSHCIHRFFLYVLKLNFSPDSNVEGYANIKRPPPPVPQVLSDQTHEKSVCSITYIKEYMIKNRYFLRHGHWTNIVEGYPYAEYSTPFCSLKPLDYDNQYVNKYINARKPGYIVLFGNRHAKKSNRELIHLMQRSGYECKLVKDEVNFTNNNLRDNYYTHGTKYQDQVGIVIKKSCSVCLSMLNICSHLDTNHTINIEYISLKMNVNSTVSVNKTFCQTNSTDQVCNVTTQLEYLFKIYLHLIKFPDLMLIFTSYVQNRGFKFDRVERDLQLMHNLIDQFAPSTTDVIWFTSTSINRKKFPVDYKDVMYEKGRNCDLKVVALNHLLFDSLLPKFLSGDKRHYGFIDLHDMSRGVQEEWSVDHEFFKPAFYQSIMGYLMQLLANDIK